ncbi:MAG TPA: BON domain-containing protein, partial [Pyrinomonadaceae bacterium]|nr:BON domain-containing protein [Pyrinomonadaceae bacterium]
QRKSRVVIETPTARREEIYTRTSRVPEDRGGYSTGTVAIVALVAIAATALILFFWMNSGTDATNANVTVATAPPTPIQAAPTPIIIQQQPVQQPQTPIIVQQPATTTQPAPVIVNPPAGTTAAPAPPANSGTDDATLESRINKSFNDDANLSTLGISVTVIGGKATLIGSVKTQALKDRAERLAHVRGVSSVDNKIMVEEQ